MHMSVALDIVSNLNNVFQHAVQLIIVSTKAVNQPEELGGGTSFVLLFTVVSWHVNCFINIYIFFIRQHGIGGVFKTIFDHCASRF